MIMVCDTELSNNDNNSSDDRMITSVTVVI